MKQLVHIHGGNSWDTYDEYTRFLREFVIDSAVDAGSELWKNTYEDVLGASWQIIRPRMPAQFNAKYFEWAIWFEKYIPFLEDGVVLVGHSLGANFLAKYLSEHELGVAIAQVHLVSGCFGHPGGFMLGRDLSKVESQCKNIFIYHSLDDTVVPYADADSYRSALPLATLVTFDDRGHFLQCTFPELMQNIQP